MFTIIENARIVVSLLKKHNIRHIVISPGGSNIPISQAVQSDSFFKCYSVVDERSAMYVAIGIYLETGELVATSCTSANATRNYVPGLTEAYYKRIPILAITTSKHPLFVGQEYMQSPYQTSLPIDSVKYSYTLPRISTEEDRELCIRRTNEAILELTHNYNGPVQLNIEVCDSETWSLGNFEIPDTRLIQRFTRTNIELLKLHNKRILIVIGEHIPFTIDEKKSIEKFCDSHNAFIYTNHISNYHGKYSLNALPILVGASKEIFDNKLTPDVVIILGGTTGDYDLFFKLKYALNHNIEYWRVNTDGKIIDTYCHLNKIFQMTITDFFDYFNSISLKENLDHTYYESWAKGLEYKNDNVDLAFSNVYLASKLHSVIPQNSRIHFSILNSLRCWSYFDLDPSIHAYCNVGAFGIDGCMSTMLGQSIVSSELCFLIIGDLSFYYDMNSLAIRHLKNNIRILLINNNGGCEFKINQIHNQVDVSQYIAADGHFKNAKSWAIDNGFEYLSSNSKEEYIKHIPSFISKSDKPIILEVFTLPHDEKEAISQIRGALRYMTEEEAKKRKLKQEIKKKIKQITGDKGINVIKRIIK